MGRDDDRKKERDEKGKKGSRQSRSRSRSRSKDRKDDRDKRRRSPPSRRDKDRPRESSKDRDKDRRRKSRSRSRSREDKRARKVEEKPCPIEAAKKAQQDEIEEQQRLRREKLAKWRAEKAAAEAGGASADSPAAQAASSNMGDATGDATAAANNNEVATAAAVEVKVLGRVKKESTEDDYFADDADDAEDDAHAPSEAKAEEPEPAVKMEVKPQQEIKKEPKMEVEEDDDPLEQFMRGVTTEVKKLEEVDRKRMSNTVDFETLNDMVRGNKKGDFVPGIRSKAEGLGTRMEVEDSIPMLDDEDQAKEKEFDIKDWLESKNQCKNLRPVDHSKMDYRPFRKNFNIIPAEIAAMTGALFAFSGYSIQLLFVSSDFIQLLFVSSAESRVSSCRP